MNEILYRAKIAGTDVWCYGLPYSVYGDYIDSMQVLRDGKFQGIEYIKVDTLGIFSGLVDKDGVRIFEGDKVFISNTISDIERYVEYSECCFELTPRYEPRTFYELSTRDRIKVIGNIYDNER